MWIKSSIPVYFLTIDQQLDMNWKAPFLPKARPPRPLDQACESWEVYLNPDYSPTSLDPDEPRRKWNPGSDPNRSRTLWPIADVLINQLENIISNAATSCKLSANTKQLTPGSPLLGNRPRHIEERTVCTPEKKVRIRSHSRDWVVALTGLPL